MPPEPVIESSESPVQDLEATWMQDNSPFSVSAERQETVSDEWSHQLETAEVGVEDIGQGGGPGSAPRSVIGKHGPVM